jgi:curved DNA-binding protein CbpA
MGFDRNYYHLLGVRPGATAQEIKIAYRNLAKKLHPDKHQGSAEKEEHFKHITEAYNTLSNESSRRQYDHLLYTAYLREQAAVHSSNPITQHRRPHIQRRKPFTRYVYSIHTKLVGALFVLFLALFSIALPVGLEVYSVETHYQKGVMLIEQGMLKEGIDHLDLAVSDIGLKTLAAANLICRVSFYHLRDYHKTINYSQIAINNCENDSLLAELHYIRGSAFSRIKESSLAKKELMAAISFDPKFDSAIFGLAELALHQLHDFEEAEKWYAELYAINPLYPKPYYSLSLMHFQLEEYESALHYIKQYLEENPEDGQALYLGGVIAFRVKDPEAGCRYLEEAAEKGYRIDNPIIAKYCGLEYN